MMIVICDESAAKNINRILGEVDERPIRKRIQLSRFLDKLTYRVKSNSSCLLFRSSFELELISISNLDQISWQIFDKPSPFVFFSVEANQMKTTAHYDRLNEFSSTLPFISFDVKQVREVIKPNKEFH